MQVPNLSLTKSLTGDTGLANPAQGKGAQRSASPFGEVLSGALDAADPQGKQTEKVIVGGGLRSSDRSLAGLSKAKPPVLGTELATTQGSDPAAAIERLPVPIRVQLSPTAFAALSRALPETGNFLPVAANSQAAGLTPNLTPALTPAPASLLNQSQTLATDPVPEAAIPLPGEKASKRSLAVGAALIAMRAQTQTLVQKSNPMQPQTLAAEIPLEAKIVLPGSLVTAARPPVSTQTVSTQIQTQLLATATPTDATITLSAEQLDQGAAVPGTVLKAGQPDTQKPDTQKLAAATLDADGLMLEHPASLNAVQSQVQALAGEVPTDATSALPGEDSAELAPTDGATVIVSPVQTLAVVALALAPAIVAETPANDPAAQDAEAESSDPLFPKAQARPLAPGPAQLEVRRASAPTDMVWEFAEQLGAQMPADKSLNGSKTDKEASAQLPGDLRNLKMTIAPEARREQDAPPASALRAAALANSLAAPVVADVAARGGDGVQAPIVDGALANRTPGSAIHGITADGRPGQAPDIGGLVDRLVEGRVQARADRTHMEMSHPDFGRVTLALGLHADDRLSIDLPGAPQELRQAVSHAINQAARSDNASSQTTGSQADNASSADRNHGEARDGGRKQDDRSSDGGRQASARRSASHTQDSVQDPAAESRRGILA